MVAFKKRLQPSLKSAGCPTFGDLAQKIFEATTAVLSQENWSTIDVVFDLYDNPYFIQGEERKYRGVSSTLQVHINFGKTPVTKQSVGQIF